jgi:hypothetical protein
MKPGRLGTVTTAAAVCRVESSTANRLFRFAFKRPRPSAVRSDGDYDGSLSHSKRADA